MTEFKFGDKTTVVRINMPENEAFARSVLEETYRNYTGQSGRVVSGEQLARDPKAFGTPKLIEVIADTSGSMNWDLNGENKIDIAKLLLLNAVNRILDLPVAARTAIMFRILGNTSHLTPHCRETELILEPGRLKDIEQYKAYVDKVLSLKAGGPTPLTWTLMEADHDLFMRYGAYKCTRDIILVSDGAETSCMNHPEQPAQVMRQKGVDIHVTAIGLRNDQEGTTQLSGVASPGRFNDTEMLAEAAKGAPYVGPNPASEYVKGKYVFPSPGEKYGELKATTSLDGKVLLPPKKP